DALGLTPVVTAEPSSPVPADVAPDGASSLDDAVRGRVAAVLRQTGWEISRTAALLGISRKTPRARLEEHARPSRGTPAPPAPPPAHRATPSAPRSTPAPEPAAASPVSAPTLTPLRWERRRVTLLRVSLIAASAPEALLETGRVIELLLDKIQSFGGRVEG